MNCDPAATLDQLPPQITQSRSARRARETCCLGDVVQQIVTRLLPDGYPNVRSVSKMMGLSARTLQRHLSEDGVTYARVVARARCEVAQRMLENPAFRVIEIALDLGYSDQAHFARAFARWTGVTPREFRTAGCRRGELPDGTPAIAECRVTPSVANAVDIKVRPEPPRRMRHGGFDAKVAVLSPRGTCPRHATRQRSGQETEHRHPDAGRHWL